MFGNSKLAMIKTDETQTISKEGVPDYINSFDKTSKSTFTK